jgi:hypothetical protein
MRNKESLVGTMVDSTYIKHPSPSTFGSTEPGVAAMPSAVASDDLQTEIEAQQRHQMIDLGDIGILCSHPICACVIWFLVEFKASSPKMGTFCGPHS